MKLFSRRKMKYVVQAISRRIDEKENFEKVVFIGDSTVLNK